MSQTTSGTSEEQVEAQDRKVRPSVPPKPARRSTPAATAVVPAGHPAAVNGTEGRLLQIPGLQRSNSQPEDGSHQTHSHPPTHSHPLQDSHPMPTANGSHAPLMKTPQTGKNHHAKGTKAPAEALESAHLRNNLVRQSDLAHADVNSVQNSHFLNNSHQVLKEKSREAGSHTLVNQDSQVIQTAQGVHLHLPLWNYPSSDTKPGHPHPAPLKHSHSPQDPDRPSLNGTGHGPAGVGSSPPADHSRSAALSTLDRLRPSCRTSRMQQLHISLDQLSLQQQQVCNQSPLLSN